MTAQTLIYRVSNNVYTPWRPTVSTIRAYSDADCAKEITATYIDESGDRDVSGSLAFVYSSGKYWRPHCRTCDIGEAWVTFSTETEAQCVLTDGLGEGKGGGGTSWNGGIKVELQDKGSWITVLESTSGNKANGNNSILTYLDEQICDHWLFVILNSHY